MRLATAAEMAEIDRLASEQHGLAVLTLMENAGRRVAEVAARLLDGLAGRQILVLCGRGHNGGDGFVAARHLRREGARTTVVLTGPAEGLRPAPAAALAEARRAGVEVHAVTDVGGLRAAAAVPGCDLAIDALLGTGFTPPARGLAAEAIGVLNDSAAPVLSVDIPSGLSADRGAVLGPAVKAAATVTFALPKPGLILHPATRLVGRLWLAAIGFPDSLLERVSPALNLATAADLRPLLGPRHPEAHKGTFGHVLVAGGSRGMSGAPALAARGALRAGAGLVTAALPASLCPPTLPGLPEAMTLPLPESAPGFVDPAALGPEHPALEGKRAVALGPGLSREPGAAGFVRGLVPGLEIPTVLDADAIAAFAGRAADLRSTAAPIVLTPHPGELARLLAVDPGEIVAARLDSALAAARESGAVVVLKGARTIVADPSGELWVNPTGNPGMASAGMGDVLAGVIAAHLARGLPPLPAALLGAYLHGLAGDLAAAEVGPWGLLATEVADRVPAAVRRVAMGGGDDEAVPLGLSLLLP